MIDQVVSYAEYLAAAHSRGSLDSLTTIVVSAVTVLVVVPLAVVFSRDGEADR